MAGIELGLKQRGALAMTPALRQAISFLALSNRELSARLADLQATNVGLVIEMQGGNRLSLELMRQISRPMDGSSPSVNRQLGGLGGVDTDTITSLAPSLVAHVAAQLPLLVRNAADRRLAQAFLRYLEPSGWLGADLDEIAAEAKCSEAAAEAVLLQLQQAEPTGLFARSLAECLSLQIVEQGLMTPAFAIFLDNLPLVAAGNSTALAQACACTTDEVAEMIRRLRRLNPKPGAGFDQAGAVQHMVDLILRRDGSGWLLELNADNLPVLKIDPERDAPAEQLRETRAILQALERRHATVLNIAAEIVARQDAHLRGPTPLAALTINEIAAAVGLHRSTVSRVTAALSIALPRKTIALRNLLSRPTPAARRLAEPMSIDAVLERMKQLTATEDPAWPLSDEALAQLLLPEGAALARRTVTKYRRLAGIPAPSTRRRNA